MDQDSAKLKWSKEAVLHLIEMWETFECLYNPKHKFYHNKHARYQALSDLAEDLDEFIPGIGPAEVKAKINYLRGQFTREVGKCNKSEAYVPNAFWYQKLSFLSDFVKVRKRENSYSSSLDSSQNSQELEEELPPPVPSKKRARQKVESLYIPLDSSQISQELEEELSPPGPSKKRARQKDESLAQSKENDVLEAATEALKSISQKISSDLESNDDAFCKFLMEEFRTLKHEVVKEDLKESFVHLLFEAKKKERRMVQNGDFNS